MQVASRANVPPFHVMDLLAAAQRRQASHGDLVNFVAGQPSTGAPAAVREEAKRLLDVELLGYTVATGVPALREAVADHHRRTTRDRGRPRRRRGHHRLLRRVPAGLPGGLRARRPRRDGPARLRLLPQRAAALGCEVVEIDCGPETRFQPTVELLDAVEGPGRRAW